MNPYNSFYWFQNAASKTLCDHIVRFAKEKEDEKKLGLTEAAGGGKVNRDKKFKNLTKKEKNLLLPSRKSEVIWLEEPWIFRNMEFWMDVANKEAKWGYKIDSVEMAQFTIYEKDGFHGWHYDGGSDYLQSYIKSKNPDEPIIGYGRETNDDNMIGKVRKISMTLNLTDPNEYSGGNLKFDFGLHNKKTDRSHVCKEIRPKGSIIFFPSFTHHTITPITKGTRYSLVTWLLGNPFK